MIKSRTYLGGIMILVTGDINIPPQTKRMNLLIKNIFKIDYYHF